MNFGYLVRHALNRAELPFDSEHLDLAKAFANDHIHDVWYDPAAARADWRHAWDTLPIIANSAEYVLTKLFDGFVPNSLRGPASNPRPLTYKDPIEFFRLHRDDTGTGTPNYYTMVELVGYDTQLPAGSRISVSSSLASITTGTVSVTTGSDRIDFSEDVMSLNQIGLRFRRTGDTRTYKIARYDTRRRVYLEEPYQGATGTGLGYAVGDVGVHVSIQGFVAGALESEDIVTDGSNVIAGDKTFVTIVSISKADLTGGRIICRNAANTVNVGILWPGDTEIERHVVRLWRTPSAAETLRFRYYIKHPLLRLDTDRPFIPQKYHPLLTRLTQASLLEWTGRAVPDLLSGQIERGWEAYRTDAQDTSLWAMVPQETDIGRTSSLRNQRDVDQDFVE